MSSGVGGHALCRRALGAVIALCAAFTAADDTPTLAPSAPAVGLVLVADAAMIDPNFARSVVLLIAHGRDGTAGVVLNRPTRVALGAALPDLPPSLRRPGAVLFAGGPLEPEVIVALSNSAAAVPAARRVASDLMLLTDPQALRALAEHADASLQVRFYAGYAGWGVGQLDAEIARGDWHLWRLSGASVLDDGNDDMWQRLDRETRGRWAAR